MKKTFIALIALSTGLISANTLADKGLKGFTCPSASQITISEDMESGTSDFNSDGKMPANLQGNFLQLKTGAHWQGFISGATPASKELKFLGLGIVSDGGVKCLYSVGGGTGSTLGLTLGNGGKGYRFTLSNGKSSSTDIKTSIIATPTKHGQVR